MAVELVDQLHDGGDRRVEGKAPGQIAGDLLDRPVGLAHQSQGVALGSGRRVGRPHWAGGVSLRRARAQPPQPGQETVHALQRALVPGRVLIGRSDEQHVAARRVDAEALDDRRRADHVAARLGHLLTVGAEDHALGEQGAERLLEVEQLHVRERLDEEARVQQVQDRVLDPADVLIDGHPLAQYLAVPRRRVVVGVAVAQVVPARVDEGVHRVGLAPAGPAAGGAGGVDPVLGGGQRRAPAGLVVLDLGQPHRELVVRDRHQTTVLAVDDRDRAAPVALARDQPVAQPEVDRLVTAALALQPGDDRPLALHRGQPVEFTRVDQVFVVGVAHEGLPGLGLGAVARGDDLADGQPERLREVVIALVVGRAPP